MDNLTTGHHEELRRLIDHYLGENRTSDLRSLITDYHPADIADVLDELPSKQAIIVSLVQSCRRI